ncbi:MAG TPA: hypothetical protein VIL46_10610, partial [Gemmataceae bacterium]
MDVVVPIVFPDYLIRAFPDVRVPTPFGPYVLRGKLPDLGHAGVLFFLGTSGLTKYYEYGRYDAAQRGLVRNRTIPDVRIDRTTGKPDPDSLKRVLKSIATQAGQGGRIAGAYIEVSGGFEPALEFVKARMNENSNPDRTPYALLTHSCLHFMRDTAIAAGASMPYV